MKGISLQRVLQNPYQGYILYGIGSEGSGYISSMEGTAIPHFLKLYGRSLKTKFHSIRFYEEITTLKIDRVFEEYDIYIDDISKEMKNFLQKDSENTLDVDWEDIRANTPKTPIVIDSLKTLTDSLIKGSRSSRIVNNIKPKI